MDEETAAAHVQTMARILGLEIAPERRKGVAEQVRAIGRAAGLVMDFDLPDTLESAEIFRP